MRGNAYLVLGRFGPKPPIFEAVHIEHERPNLGKVRLALGNGVFAGIGLYDLTYEHIIALDLVYIHHAALHAHRTLLDHGRSG
jgi:hypothetical protein